MTSSKSAVDYTYLYNNLPPVESAHEELERSTQFSDFLKDFSHLACDEGMDSMVGAQLLHRHFSIKSGEILLESLSRFDKENIGLVSQPTKRTANCRYSPSRWLFSDAGSIVAIEFTTDPESRVASQKVLSSPRFLACYSALLREYTLQELIGLCVSMNSLCLSAKQQLFERTYVDGSVVTVEPKRENDGSSLPTVWVPEISMGCIKTSCMSLCTPGTWDPPRAHRKTGHIPYHRPTSY